VGFTPYKVRGKKPTPRQPLVGNVKGGGFGFFVPFMFLVYSGAILNSRGLYYVQRQKAVLYSAVFRNGVRNSSPSRMGAQSVYAQSS
jgi:hypothetical protein